MMDIIYKTCNYCGGNGYTKIFSGIISDTVITCVKCGGAGYFYPNKTNNETRTTDTNLKKESVLCQQP